MHIDTKWKEMHTYWYKWIHIDTKYIHQCINLKVQTVLKLPSLYYLRRVIGSFATRTISFYNLNERIPKRIPEEHSQSQSRALFALHSMMANLPVQFETYLFDSSSCHHSGPIRPSHNRPTLEIHHHCAFSERSIHLLTFMHVLRPWSLIIRELQISQFGITYLHHIIQNLVDLLIAYGSFRDNRDVIRYMLE